MTIFIDPHLTHLSAFQSVLWCIYLVAAVMLPAFRYRRVADCNARRARAGSGAPASLQVANRPDEVVPLA